MLRAFFLRVTDLSTASWHEVMLRVYMADLAKQKEMKEAQEKCVMDCGGMVEGARCEVSVLGQLTRRATIRYEELELE